MMEMERESEEVQRLGLSARPRQTHVHFPLNPFKSVSKD